MTPKPEISSKVMEDIPEPAVENRHEPKSPTNGNDKKGQEIQGKPGSNANQGKNAQSVKTNATKSAIKTPKKASKTKAKKRKKALKKKAAIKGIDNNNKEGNQVGTNEKKKNNNNAKNDNSTEATDNDEASQRRLIFLEEKVRIREAEVQAWAQRKEQIATEKERLLAKKRTLLLKRDEIIKKQELLQDARSKNLALKAQLTESLATSQERLKMLLEAANEEGINIDENEDTNDNEDNKGENQNTVDDTTNISPSKSIRKHENIPPMGTEKDHQGPSPKRLKLSIDGDNNASRKARYSEVVPDPYTSFETMSDYHCRGSLPFVLPTSEKSPPFLLALMPYLNATQVGGFMMLMMREANALDLQHQSNERNPRQKLLEKTSLDVLLLASQGYSTLISNGNDNSNNNNNNRQGTDPIHAMSKQQSSPPASPAAREETDIEANFLNPNISLCPYELEGICADDLCPYQHTRKATVARERLPLPSLMSFLSTPVAGAVKQKPKNSQTNENLSSAKKTDAPKSLTPNISDDNDDDGCAEDGEDVMVLPFVARENLEDDDESEVDDTKRISLDQTLGNYDNVSATDSEDDDLDEGRLPLSDTLSQYGQGGDREETEPTNGSTFWWGGRLPTHRCGSCQGTENAEELELSIQDILSETFGLVFIDMDSTAPNNTIFMESSWNAKEKRLEVATSLHMNHMHSNNEDTPKHIQELKFLGRLTDASRLALHGGLDCTVVALSRVMKVSANNESQCLPLGEFVNLVTAQINVCRLYDKEPNLSCFLNAFAAQLGLAIVSWSVAAMSKQCHSEQPSKQHIVKSACNSCWAVLRCPLLRTSSPEQFNADRLKSRLMVSGLGTTDAEQNEGIPVAKDGQEIAKAINKLHSLISWAKKTSAVRTSGMIDVSGEELEERLNETWFACRSTLKDWTSQRKHTNKDHLDWEFLCLKVTIIMGYSIFGAISSFACAAAERESKGGGNERARSNGSRLSARNVAAWNILDGAIARILKNMRKHLVSTVPLIDVVLAPLYACSVASTCFLQNYSVAQNRLTECIGERYRCWNNSKYPSTNIMTFSDLLWSQLVQLRMSLPNESLSSCKITDLSTFGKKILSPSTKTPVSTRDRTYEFPWEPSQLMKDEMKLFISKLESRGIHLRYVVLWGDWILSSLVEKHKGMLYLFTANSSQSKSRLSLRISEHLNKLRGDETTPSYGHRYPPAQPLPQIPLALLHAGHLLTTLHLGSCGLDRLPRSFGLYFPNLKRLGLSRNKLRELPESFQGMTERMKSLEFFNISFNSIVSLPPNMFSNASSAIASSSPSPPLLKYLDLSHNVMVTLPSLVNLTQLEVLKLNNNALVDRTAADWSRFTLKLPGLRAMDYSYQTKKD